MKDVRDDTAKYGDVELADKYCTKEQYIVVNSTSLKNNKTRQEFMKSLRLHELMSYLVAALS